MTALRPLLRAELLKLRWSRSVRWVSAGTAVATLVAVLIALRSHDGDELAGADGLRDVLTLGGVVAFLAAFGLGIAGMAGEQRTGVLGRSLLAAPKRWPLVLAKALAHAAAGAVLGLVALVVAYAVGLPGLESQDAGTSFGAARPRGIAIGTVLAPALFGALGVGLAALLGDQVRAVAAGVVLVVGELVLAGAAPEVDKLLPTGLVTGMLRAQTDDVLAAPAATLLLAAWAVVVAAVGAQALRHRDVTGVRTGV